MNKPEAQQNLQMLEQDRSNLLALNHLNSTYAFKDSCEKRIKQINENLKNIKVGLHEHRSTTNKDR